MLAKTDPIAIVGGGASGLVTIKALQSEGFTDIQLYERREDIGGVWLFDDDDEKVVDGVSPDVERFPSPMYDALVGNIWYKLLELDSHKFPHGTPDFPTRAQMLDYLRAYADECRPMVQTCANVVSVDKSGDEWIVQVRDTRAAQGGKVTERRFKGLVLATGLYDTPDNPQIPGLADLPDGVVLHSKYYRKPDIFAGQKILIMGNGPSGIDIAAQSAGVAQLPIIRTIHGPAEHAVLEDDRILDSPAVDHFEPETRTAVLVDGTRIEGLDRVIISTGYRFSFPFMSAVNAAAPQPLVTNGLRLHGLYKHIFWRHDPTLAFVGLLVAAIPFPISEAQALTLARVWSGRLSLPSEEVMRKDEEDRLEQWGDTYKFHKMRYPQDADYGDDLRRWCEEAVPRKEREKLPVQWTEERRLWRRMNLEKKVQQLRDARGW